jgi:CHAT domain-containing protein/tetratricopeptide (TPR) repeat protein
MKRAVSFLATFLLMACMSSFGQCPDNEALMKCLRDIDYYKKYSYKTQISRWLPYLDSLKVCGMADDSVYAYLNRKIGSLYNDDKDYLNAIKYYSRFLHITRANLGKPNFSPLDLIGGYYYLAKMYQGLDMTKERMAALDSCINYSEVLKNANRASMHALYQKVEYYFDIGDYYRSMDYATRCESMARECQKSSDLLLQSSGFQYYSSSTAKKYEALIKLGELAGADEYISEKIRESATDKNRFNLGTFCVYLAQVHMAMGNTKDVVSLLEKALKHDDQAGYYLGCAQTLNILGSEIYLNYYHDDSKAFQCYDKALRYLNKDNVLSLPVKMEALNLYTNIAEVFVRRNQLDSAFRYFKTAFEQVVPGGEGEDIFRSPNPELLRQTKVNYITNLLISKGDAWKMKSRISGNRQFLEEALRVYRLTDRFLDLLRNEQTELESKLFWRKDTRRLYEHAIDACFSLKDEAEAFYFFEKSRAALLSDQLTEQRWVGDHDIRKEIQLRKNITQVTRKLDTSDRASGTYDELVRSKSKLTSELENVHQQIRADNPLYYHNLVDTGFMTLLEARKVLLPEYAAMIETFAGDSAVYVLAITGKGNSLRKLDKEHYYELVGDYSRLLADQGSLNKEYATFRRSAGELYDLIFQKERIPAGRIIISPDGPNFPFEALVISGDGGPVQYLVQEYAVSYTYSVRFLLSGSGSTQKTTPADFIGIAPVEFNPVFRLASLNGSDRSIERLEALFRNSFSLTGHEATKREFLEKFHRYQIVQLYTHATDSGVYKEPVIYFQDSLLNLSDLAFQERPFTRLVVLAACRTGLGKLNLGEGVFSFSRGFAALGIPSSITNLWSVENESTYRLTELFYAYLAKGQPLDIALQKAKMEFIRTSTGEKKLPNFWAAQVLSGRTDPILIRKPWPLRTIALVAGAFLAFLPLAWWIRRKNGEKRSLA